MLDRYLPDTGRLSPAMKMFATFPQVEVSSQNSESTASQPAGHAKTPQTPAGSTSDSNRDSTASEPDSFPKSYAWLDGSSPGTYCWRTYQLCLFTDGGSVEYSDNWPTSGLLSSGKLYPQRLWVSDIHGLVSSSWPTPTTRDWKDTGSLTNTPENGLLGRVYKNRTGKNLHPIWSEYLMGFRWQIEWTASKSSGPP